MCDFVFLFRTPARPLTVQQRKMFSPSAREIHLMQKKMDFQSSDPSSESEPQPKSNSTPVESSPRLPTTSSNHSNGSLTPAEHIAVESQRIAHSPKSQVMPKHDPRKPQHSARFVRWTIVWPSLLTRSLFSPSPRPFHTPPV